MKDKRSALSFLGEVTGGKKIYIFWLLLLQAVLGVVSIFYALATRGVIDRAVEGDKTGFVRCILGFAGLVVCQLVLRAVLRFMEEYSKSTYENSFRERLFTILLTGDYQSISKTHSGEWMNRLTSDTQVVAEGLVTIVPGLSGMLIKIAGSAAMILYLAPESAFFMIPGGILLVVFTWGFRKTLKRLHRTVQEKDGVVRSFLQETLESALVVRSCAVESEMAGKAVGLMEEHRNARIRRNLFSSLCNIGFGAAMYGAYALGLAWCGYGLLTHTMSYGTLMAVVQLISQVQSPFANITGYVPKYHAMTASAERLMEAEVYAGTETDYHSREEAREYYEKEFSGLFMEHVDFSYDGVNPVLKDFSMQVAKGESVAFTGKSGCGKSTVLKLLLGLYRPDAGSISVDKRYRRLFAYVPQGNFLMSGTILDVITMADRKEKGNEKKIRQALNAACAEFVYDLPEGLMTELGERGLGLSEGQMQRLAVARALFSGSPVLLLDEATSALDESTEKQVLERLKVMTDKTVIIITHRPAARSICDKEIHFEKED